MISGRSLGSYKTIHFVRFRDLLIIKLVVLW
jgi:hypothetical protein